MTERVCKNCKHWQPIYVEQEPKLGWCQSKKVFESLDWCPITHEFHSRPTSENFGCVYWEEKNPGPFVVVRVFASLDEYTSGAKVREWGIVSVPRGSDKAIATYPCEDAANDACTRWNELWGQRDRISKVEWHRARPLGIGMVWEHQCSVVCNNYGVRPGRYCPHCGAKAPGEAET